MKLFLAKSLVAVDGISKIEDYRKNSSLQQTWALKGLESSPIADQDSVLDVGCGDGKITASIANERAKGLVVGIDISNAMIKLAKSTYKSKNLIFCQRHATSIPYQ